VTITIIATIIVLGVLIFVHELAIFWRPKGSAGCSLLGWASSSRKEGGETVPGLRSPGDT
jgi:hypothetical protein